MADSFRKRVLRAWTAFKGKSMTRSYIGARNTRLTSDWNPSTTSADSELVGNLRMLRDRCRALMRDGSYAKRAQTLIVNNVIGSGIGMQGQVMTTRGELNVRVNDAIEREWQSWSYAYNCHTGGRLAFKHLERLAMGQVVAAGEVLIRKHRRAVGMSKVPLALEVIESERIADTIDTTGIAPAPGNEIRMGIEVDDQFRPVAYFLRKRHPSEFRFTGVPDYIERVPADQIMHLAMIDRWPQTRGEPWLHTAMRRLNDVDGYSEAEIVRARVQATSVGAIETPEDVDSFGEVQSDGSAEMEMEPGLYKRLNPGEKLNAAAPTSPNPALDPFMRYMLREIAAGIGVSYASLSMDYSQSNYSSSRLALLDDRDLWKFYQSWFICDFREVLHREWLLAAMMAKAIPEISLAEYAVSPEKFEAVQFKPRGWSWIDPQAEVEAFGDAIEAGMTTLTDVIAQTAGGQDIEDILRTRERELQMMKDRGLVFTTSPEVYTAEAKESQAKAKQAARPPEKPPDEGQQPATEEPAERRVFRLQR